MDKRSYGSNIWISFPEDLIYWGDSKSVMLTRPGFWDMKKIGAGAPPILTEKGWLMIYHGVKGASWGNIYRLGCAMFDQDDPPQKLIGRCLFPVLSPTEYEKQFGKIKKD